MFFATILTQQTAVPQPASLCAVIWFLILFFGSLWFVGYFDEQSPTIAPADSLSSQLPLGAAQPGSDTAAPSPTELAAVQQPVSSKQALAQEINPNNDWSRHFLTSLNIRQLKTLASVQQIRHYGTMRKEALITALSAPAPVSNVVPITIAQTSA